MTIRWTYVPWLQFIAILFAGFLIGFGLGMSIPPAHAQETFTSFGTGIVHAIPAPVICQSGCGVPPPPCQEQPKKPEPIESDGSYFTNKHWHRE